MAAPGMIVKLPWPKIWELFKVLGPAIYEKTKEILAERKKSKEKEGNRASNHVDDRVKAIEEKLASVEGNIVAQAEALQKIQDELNLIASALTSFRYRQNVVIGLSVGAIVMSIASLAALLAR